MVRVRESADKSDRGAQSEQSAHGSPRAFSPVRPLPEQRLWSLEPEGGSPSPGNRPTREPRGGGGVGEAGARGAFALPTPHVRLITCEQHACVRLFFILAMQTVPRRRLQLGPAPGALRRAWPHTSCGG